MVIIVFATITGGFVVIGPIIFCCMCKYKSNPTQIRIDDLRFGTSQNYHVDSQNSNSSNYNNTNYMNYTYTNSNGTVFNIKQNNP